MNDQKRAEMLDRMRADVEDLGALLGTVPADRLHSQPGAGEWSPAMIFSHLADSELTWGFRLRLILTRERPPLTAYDQDAVAARVGPVDSDPQRAFQRWRLLRENNVSILESLSEDDWQRVGLHEERGEVSAADVAEVLVDHVPGHGEQIRRAIQTGGGGAP